MHPVVPSRSAASAATLTSVAVSSLRLNQNQRQQAIERSTIATASIERRQSVVVGSVSSTSSSSSSSPNAASSRRSVVVSAATSTSSTSPSSSSTRDPDADYLALKGIKVYPASEDKDVAPVEVLSLFRAAPEDRTLMVRVFCFVL